MCFKEMLYWHVFCQWTKMHGFFLLASDKLHIDTNCLVVNMLHTKNRWMSSNVEKLLKWQLHFLLRSQICAPDTLYEIRADAVLLHSHTFPSALNSILNHSCIWLTSYTVITLSAPEDEAALLTHFLLRAQSFLLWLHVHGKSTAVPIHSVKWLVNLPYHLLNWGFCTWQL